MYRVTMNDESPQNRTYLAYLRTEKGIDDPERRRGLIQLAFANPEYHRYAAHLKADIAFSLTEALHDQSQKEKPLYKKEGIAGLVITTLLTSMDRVGMDPTDPVQLLYATQFVESYIPNDTFEQILNRVLLQLRKIQN